MEVFNTLKYNLYAKSWQLTDFLAFPASITPRINSNALSVQGMGIS